MNCQSTIDNNLLDNTETNKAINNRFADTITKNHAKGNNISDFQTNNENLNNIGKTNNTSENKNMHQKVNKNIPQNINKNNKPNTDKSDSKYTEIFKKLDKLRYKIWNNRIIGTLFIVLCCFLYFGTLFFGLSHIFKILTRYTRFNVNRGLSLIILGIGLAMHVIIFSALFNRVSFYCPDYDEEQVADKNNKNFDWYRLPLTAQLMDIGLSIGFLVLGARYTVKIWRTGFNGLLQLGIWKSLGIISDPNGSTPIGLRKYHIMKEKELNGNLTVAFMTFQFQKNLKHKLSYIISHNPITKYMV
jgi:hypothetical protein